MNLISPRALVAALTLAASALLPVTASATPGTPTSAHPIDHLAGVSGGTAEKISYESTLMDGSPTTVTGIIYEPSAAWIGPGERPTIVFAPGTRGAGDQCAPSNAAQSVGNVALGPANQVTLNMNYEYASLASKVGGSELETTMLSCGPTSGGWRILQPDKAARHSGAHARGRYFFTADPFPSRFRFLPYLSRRVGYSY